MCSLLLAVGGACLWHDDRSSWRYRDLVTSLFRFLGVSQGVQPLGLETLSGVSDPDRMEGEISSSSENVSACNLFRPAEGFLAALVESTSSGSREPFRDRHNNNTREQTFRIFFRVLYDASAAFFYLLLREACFQRHIDHLSEPILVRHVVVETQEVVERDDCISHSVVVVSVYVGV
mmetsp:Transcript_43644/g.138033  ORF Transcript_43644/g.138033 Transcript_43644/m.138033 type:complete len:177 (-) Transcript_43644:483-1013(-)